MSHHVLEIMMICFFSCSILYAIPKCTVCLPAIGLSMLFCGLSLVILSVLIAVIGSIRFIGLLGLGVRSIRSFFCWWLKLSFCLAHRFSSWTPSVFHPLPRFLSTNYPDSDVTQPLISINIHSIFSKTLNNFSRNCL